MEEKKVVLIAVDFAPVQALDQLDSALIGGGRTTVTFLNEPKNSWERKIISAVESSYALITGMSSSQELSHEELFAVRRAKMDKIPIFFYADTFGVYK